MKINESLFFFLKLMLYFIISKEVENKTFKSKSKMRYFTKIINISNNYIDEKNNFTNSTEKLQNEWRELHGKKNNHLINNTNINTTYGIGECTMSNCYLPYGICLNLTTCMCMPDYANFNLEEIFLLKNKIKTDSYLYPKQFCSYKKKSIIIAGLLELFLPLGLGHFYAGHLFLGWLKFSYNFLIYTFGCLLHFKSQWNDSDTYFELMLLCIIFSCVIPIWNVLDLFLFFTGSYKDGNGIEMA
jgi:hypothetical protein